MSYKTIKTAVSTIIDRKESQIDRVIHKPFNDRILLYSPIEIVSKISEKAEPNEQDTLVESFLGSIQSKNLPGQIDNEMQKNLPNRRYEAIKNFNMEKDWVSILESIYILIRLLKPNLIVETGVGEIGMSSSYIY